MSVALVGLVVLLVLAVVWASATAAAPPSAQKPVKKTATIKLVPSFTLPEDHALFTVGHAMIAGQCAGPDAGVPGGVLSKVTITAVGGDITIVAGDFVNGIPIPNGEPLSSGQTDAVFVIGYSPAEGPGAATNSFAVFDSAGPSFSGTAAAWVTSTGCVITAQVAG